MLLVAGVAKPRVAQVTASHSMVFLCGTPPWQMAAVELGKVRKRPRTSGAHPVESPGWHKAQVADKKVL